MATGGFKSTAATDFLEEWKAKREKMRAKMLGDIAAATGAPLGSSGSAHAAGTGTGTGRQAAAAAAAAQGTELTNNGNPERSASSGNCLPSSYSVARSSSGTTLRRAEEETHHQQHHQHQHQHPAAAAAPHPSPAAAPCAAAASHPKKAPPHADKAPCASPDPAGPAGPGSPAGPMACNDSDKESPSPGKGKEKKSSGPSARKGKGQIEKRKLREKRRSTGVVSMPSNEEHVASLMLFCHLLPFGLQNRVRVKAPSRSEKEEPSGPGGRAPPLGPRGTLTNVGVIVVAVQFESRSVLSGSLGGKEQDVEQRRKTTV
ncbi:hypothetical protein F2P81_019016 [Scophthalmus maximus]|uniref:PRKC apoptosis WT1 regulator protein n=1 Tax=Scophthalmus maximus TaxID=52904 RepID=A0A6A4SFG4_SCOMX|nr:hypothetical protein F2P81_019016 [Scophthalmus maximus]